MTCAATPSLQAPAGVRLGTGRIAGAVHIEWNRVFGENETLLPEADLRELFADVLNYDGSLIERSYAANSAGSFESRGLVRQFTEEWTDNNGPI